MLGSIQLPCIFYARLILSMHDILYFIGSTRLVTLQGIKWRSFLKKLSDNSALGAAHPSFSVLPEYQKCLLPKHLELKPGVFNWLRVGGRDEWSSKSIFRPVTVFHAISWGLWQELVAVSLNSCSAALLTHTTAVQIRLPPSYPDTTLTRTAIPK